MASRDDDGSFELERERPEIMNGIFLIVVVGLQLAIFVVGYIAVAFIIHGH